MDYNFKKIEENWQKFWAENQTFRADNHSEKPKCYVLDMFPYPSGAGLHVGHPLGYIASDIYSRYKRLKGFNVLHPMGYDSFGLPAEQYAIQTGQHPAITTEKNIDTYRRQLDQIGFSFDWSREIRTSDPSYYKWTQWIFIQLFNSWYNNDTDKAETIGTLVERFKKEGNKNVNAASDEVEIFSADEWNKKTEEEQQKILLNYRLAFLADSWVNWCPALGTVLANDEVKDGVSERGGYPVEQKLMKQWSLRITAYSERLLTGLDTIDWPEPIKEMQRNWIGKSEGASISYQLIANGHQLFIEVFTTRPDTIFGVSFVTLAPEHDLVDQITTPEYKEAVEAYKKTAAAKSERDRMSDVKTISGQFTGAYVEHPFTGKPIPVWIGDYVLATYGTGAVMAVPAHDARDYAFAQHFNLPIIEVIQPVSGLQSPVSESNGAYDAKEGKMINSDFLNGLEVKDAIKKAIQKIEEKNIGKGKINYRQRDAIFGRQRYWGEPIPVYYKNDIPYVMDEKDLPLVLPEVDKFLPTEDGEPPLARAKDWHYNPETGLQSPVSGYPLETTTMPGWAGSSWYFFRYMDSHNDQEFASKEYLNYWQNVDLYIGGSEHATGHLLYSRFWCKFLKDLGYTSVDEPFRKLINQGMIQGVSQKIRQHSIFKTGEGESISNSFSIYNPSGIDYQSIRLNRMKSIFISEDAIEPDLDDRVFYSHIDISFVDNSVLNVQRYVKDRREKDNKFDAIFICKGGYWENDKFISVYNDASDKFLTKPEVEKMSKSKYNVVNPDDIVNRYGADTLRMYEMFLGPLEQSKPWNTNGIEGVFKFLRKFWKLFHDDQFNFHVSEAEPTKAELKALHTIIKKVEEDIDRFSFNTSVSSFMICVNTLTDLKCNKRKILEELVVVLSPYAPHICEELWNKLNREKMHKTTSVSYASYPKYNPDYLVEDEFAYPISINGKTKMNLNLSLNLEVADIEKEVLANADVQRYLGGKAPKKVIVVKGRIVNIVI